MALKRTEESRKRKKFELLIHEKSSRARPMPPPPTMGFDANFRNEVDKERLEWIHVEKKVKQIRTIKLADFVDARFIYLTQFKEFRWIRYLTTQCLVHDNLIHVFFNNVELETASEDSEDPCQVVAINTYFIGKDIQVT